MLQDIIIHDSETRNLTNKFKLKYFIGKVKSYANKATSHLYKQILDIFIFPMRRTDYILLFLMCIVI